VAVHIFQARPVWIYTQSNITNIIIYAPSPKDIAKSHKPCKCEKQAYGEYSLLSSFRAVSCTIGSDEIYLINTNFFIKVSKTDMPWILLCIFDVFAVALCEREHFE
jgi:hypothetical protein